MKHLYIPFFAVLTILHLVVPVQVYSQAPQYSYTPNLITSNAIPLNSSSNLRQNLYYPSDFNAPSGNVDKIYIGGNATAPSFSPLTIKVGPTTLTTFTTGPFVSGLTTVFSGNVSLTLVNGWYEVPLTTPFYYDNSQNLIIEISQLGASGSSSSPCASSSAVPSTNNRTLYGAIGAASGSLQARLMKMGFSLSPLSLDLLGFSAATGKDKVSLVWKTANEKNISKFVVERGTDGSEFKEIGVVLSKGATSRQQEYFFDDAYPRQSRTLYRLKIVEDDASFHYSATIAVSPKASGDALINVHPLPFRDELFATLSSDKGGQVRINIFDISGKRVITRQEYIENGTHVVQIPSLATLSPGIYELIVELNHNVFRETLRK